MQRRPDYRVVLLLRAAALLGLIALMLATDADAQGVSFGAPGRVPRQQDSDIGSGSSGDPSVDYMLHCQGCHLSGGEGLAGAVPRLKGSIAGIATMPGGREYLLRVPGVAQSQLDDAALAALLNWIVSYFDAEHLPADFRPFTAGEVATMRSRPLVQASVERASLLATAAPAH